MEVIIIILRQDENYALCLPKIFQNCDIETQDYWDDSFLKEIDMQNFEIVHTCENEVRVTKQGIYQGMFNPTVITGEIDELWEDIN